MTYIYLELLNIHVSLGEVTFLSMGLGWIRPHWVYLFPTCVCHVTLFTGTEQNF